MFVIYRLVFFSLREDEAVKVEELGKGCLACRALWNSITIVIFFLAWHETHETGKVLFFQFQRSENGLVYHLGIWHLEKSLKILGVFSHCSLCMDALIMSKAPQCCTFSYSVAQQEILLSSFTFSVSWWLCLANKLWILRNSDDNAGSCAGYRMQLSYCWIHSTKEHVEKFLQAVKKSFRDALHDQKCVNIRTLSLWYSGFHKD